VERVLSLAGEEPSVRPFLRCSELPLEALLQAAPAPADRVRATWDWEGEMAAEGGAGSEEETALAEALKELRRRGGGVDFQLFEEEGEAGEAEPGERKPPRLHSSLHAALMSRPALLALCRALAARQMEGNGAASSRIAEAVLFAAAPHSLLALAP